MQFQLYTIVTVLLFCSMSVSLKKYFSRRLLIDFSSDCICQSCTFSSGCWTSWNYSKHFINIILLEYGNWFNYLLLQSEQVREPNCQVGSPYCNWPGQKNPSLDRQLFTTLVPAFDISFAFYSNRNFCQFNTFRRYRFPNTSFYLRHLLRFLITIGISANSMFLTRRTTIYHIIFVPQTPITYYSYIHSKK